MSDVVVSDAKLTYNRCFTQMLQVLAGKKSKAPGCGRPLWGLVADMCGIGSTSASEMLVELGFDPSASVIEPVWPDPVDEVVAQVCDTCEGLFTGVEGCPHCSDED